MTSVIACFAENADALGGVGDHGPVPQIVQDGLGLRV